MIREIPAASAAPAAVSPLGRRTQQRGDPVQGRRAQPFGELGRARGAQGGHRPVDVVLARRLARRRTELGVAQKPFAQGREGEGLQDVLDHTEGDALADHGQVPRGGHHDHVHGVSGGAQPAREAQAVSVGQAEVEEQQVDAGPFQHPGGLGERVDGADGGEAGHPADVERVRVGGDRVVLDHQDAHVGPAHCGLPAVRSAARGGATASRSAPASRGGATGRRTVNSAPPPGPCAATTAPP